MAKDYRHLYGMQKNATEQTKEDMRAYFQMLKKEGAYYPTDVQRRRNIIRARQGAPQPSTTFSFNSFKDALGMLGRGTIRAGKGLWAGAGALGNLARGMYNNADADNRMRELIRQGRGRLVSPQDREAIQQEDKQRAVRQAARSYKKY